MAKRQIKSATEEDVFSLRRIFVWTQRAGATDAVKRRARRRERRDAKRDIRRHNNDD